MQSGDLLGGRYRIESLAQSGGMGQVYRASDLDTGAPVAAKILLDTSPEQRARFQQEAALLAALSHPGVVRYIAHDAPPAPDGRPFLVMEWLDGEDLAALLLRRRLDVAETVELAARVAEALGAAHQRGIVHRDLKPANIFLVGGDVRRPKLLDFGIAHLLGHARITGAWSLFGTPAYMAPEQARSGDFVDARADVFSLGCVLFECLTGVPPFRADHLAALLAKIVLEEAPRVRDLLPAVPPWLDALVARMLCKAPARRPRDGVEIAAALAAEEAAEPPSSTAAPPALGGGERHFIGVLVIGRRPSSAHDATLSATAEALAERGAHDIARRFGAHFELLADGSAVLVVSFPPVPTDIAAQLARCALAVRAQAPERHLAVATGWGELGRDLPIGDAVARAARLLHRADPGSAPRIAIDEVTAGLLEARFEITGSGRTLELRGERPAGELWRPLLGKTTPCVGRDHELSLLEQTFASCSAEPAARAVLVTGPAGMGKSRLVRELVDRLCRSGRPHEVWIGRGDPWRAGSTSGLLADAIRNAVGIHGGEPLERRRAALHARVARRVAGEDRPRVADFLGELIGAPAAEGCLALRAARQDPDLLGEQMQRALRDFLRAECAARPVLLVLEDVQWSDRASITAVDALLRDLADLPLMALGTARPEVSSVFPELWVEHGRQEISLRRLSPRASARLARHALGDGAAEGEIERVVAQSEGHPFFLEELIRAAAEGCVRDSYPGLRADEPRAAPGPALPRTLVAMVQVRLERLEPAARRVLRAASVLGAVFWRGAVAHLLGGDPSAEEDAALQGLVAEEICVRHAVSRLAGEHEYAFRQELLREGAYALLTEEDRALGHRLAAEWLARAGEADPLVLAGHLARGGVLPRAAELYVRGAELAAARRAYLDAERCYARAAELAGPLPVAARRGRGLARFRLGRHDDALAELSAARAQAAAAGDVAAEVEILLDEAMVLDWRGDHVAAAELTAAARERGAAITAPALRARLLLGLGRMLHRADREAEAASELARAAELAAGLGDDGHETHIIALLLLGFILPWIGRLDDAARSLDEAIRRCEERSDLMHLGAALSNRALVRSYRGDREGMAADLERTIALGAQLGQPVLELVGHFNLAESLYWMDDLDAAEPHARAAAALVSRCGGSYRPAVLALEGRLHLYRGDEPRARAAAEELRALGGAPGAGALSPSEDVLCAMLELATAEADESAWDALEARSAQCSAGQEKIEVLEARALSALRRGRRAEARRRLESALSASARIPSCMSGRLRRWIAEAAACP